MPKCYTCRKSKPSNKYLQCAECIKKQMPLGEFIIHKHADKHISKDIQNKDIKDNEIVVRNDQGDPMAIAEADKPLPKSVRNINGNIR